MTGLEFLDLVIGLIFIYLIYSIAASTLWEIFVNITHLRGNMLHGWITDNFKLLNSPATPQQKDGGSNQILDHPLIKGASGKSNGKPSYISSRVFADVLVDIVIKADKSITDVSKLTLDLKTFRNSLVDTPVLPPGLRTVFLQYTDEVSINLQKVKDRIGNWYDEAQERLLGSYKKNLQRWILIISVILVGGTNADTIRLASYLYNNDEARSALATRASLLVQDSSIINLKSRIAAAHIVDSVSVKSGKEIVKTLDSDVKILASLNNELKKAGLPLGWGHESIRSFGLKEILKKLGGLLLTALAVSMGSPFWFDILSKLSNLRAAGKKPGLAMEAEPVKEAKK
jgi:hypothetical protein